MKTLVVIAALVLLASMAVFASQQEDRAADSVAAAFVQARDAARLSKLERMDGNTFREKVCTHDLRFASGVILTAQYQTSDPGNLPEVAQQLAVHPDDGYRVTNRFGVGACAVGQEPSGKTVYSVLIATYESPWNSFLRFFWE
jgi:type II secretory pathway pseudopilin PulG